MWGFENDKKGIAGLGADYAGVAEIEPYMGAWRVASATIGLEGERFSACP